MQQSGNGSYGEQSSNRTFMELKLSVTASESSPKRCSNRTFMELKFIRLLQSAGIASF